MCVAFGSCLADFCTLQLLVFGALFTFGRGLRTTWATCDLRWAISSACDYGLVRFMFIELVSCQGLLCVVEQTGSRDAGMFYGTEDLSDCLFDCLFVCLFDCLFDCFFD